MDALNGGSLRATEFKDGNALYLLCNSPACDCDEAEQIEEAFLTAIARRDLRIIKIRSDYRQDQGEVSLAAQVVPRKLVCLGRVCYEG